MAILLSRGWGDEGIRCGVVMGEILSDSEHRWS